MSNISKNNPIYYEFKKRNKTNKTMIFIHGITGSSSAWEKFYNYFFKLGYNVLKLDLRGHGLSLKQNLKEKIKLNDGKLFNFII